MITTSEITNGAPNRSSRSLRKYLGPFRVRLFQTNRPEMKNIRGMTKVFKKGGARSNPAHFMGSTMGATEWEKFSGLNLDEVE